MISCFRKYRYLNFALPLIVILGGCSEKYEPQPLTYTELLTGKEKKEWVIQAIEIIDEGRVNTSYNLLNLMSRSCRRDDAMVFYNNSEKKFEWTNGASKCATSEPDVLLEYEWDYQTANASLWAVLPVSSILFGDLYYLPYTVKKLNQNELVIELYESNVFSDPSDTSYRITYSAK